ncbi:tRNA (adenosine(37)-N6)-threonylcarbamoyltransferase complex ATPase subunit type 1 TsaE [Mesonia aquimarina]|uniref:tRNA (adenosine(37)-N6)-threonylcarbamoyltransferase complex ATPase subunit type 1 TsaE n=1 Tax=Mesonia aquimarina TaxID=1504967 RepID=UPI000EF63049|nr:tRNA (adenosine(37)-N6)-threonylcarbamoyltransferase complex ATPase subunit type 1 TsaE [Mesonia aquimarina]
MEISYKLNEISSIARKVIKVSSHKTLLFYGEMGAGKTTLIKEIVKQLGSKDNVTSPTFSLVNEYTSTNEKIYHFDFYRIEEESEALDIGIEEYFIDKNWLFIEWPEKIPNLIPEKFTKLELKKVNLTTRKVFIQ